MKKWQLVSNAGFKEDREQIIQTVLLNGFQTERNFLENVAAGGPSDTFKGNKIDWYKITSEERHALILSSSEILSRRTECKLF